MYVGRTYGTPGGRFAQHIRAKANRPLADQLRGWILKGLAPSFEILAKGDGDCRGVERQWVARLREWGYELFNRTYGGEPTRLDPSPVSNKQPTGPSDMLRVRRALEYATWNGRGFRVNR